MQRRTESDIMHSAHNSRIAKCFHLVNKLDEILTGGSGGDESEVEQVTGFLGWGLALKKADKVQ